MNTKKNIGIWMDHSQAHLMEVTGNDIVSKVIRSEFTHASKERSLFKNENLMHNKEQHEQHSYYKKISEGIQHASEIVVFGPTTAKSELANLLKEDQHFKDVKIDVVSTDKLTENQQCDYVRTHFKSSINK